MELQEPPFAASESTSGAGEWNLKFTVEQFLAAGKEMVRLVGALGDSWASGVWGRPLVGLWSYGAAPGDLWRRFVVACRRQSMVGGHAQVAAAAHNCTLYRASSGGASVCVQTLDSRL